MKKWGEGRGGFFCVAPPPPPARRRRGKRGKSLNFPAEAPFHSCLSLSCCLILFSFHPRPPPRLSPLLRRLKFIEILAPGGTAKGEEYTQDKREERKEDWEEWRRNQTRHPVPCSTVYFPPFPITCRVTIDFSRRSFLLYSTYSSTAPITHRSLSLFCSFCRRTFIPPPSRP